MTDVPALRPPTPAELVVWRHRRYLSQPDLANLLGVHWMTVAKWEQGQRTPPAYLSLALANLDVTEEWPAAAESITQSALGQPW